MRQMKRILVLLLTFAMVFSNTSGIVFAEEANENLEIIQDAVQTEGILQTDGVLPSDAAVPVTFALSFDANGGSSEVPAEPVIVAAGQTVELPDNLFAPPACKTFAGWKIPEIGEEIYPPHTLLTLAQSLTAVAQWAEDPNAAHQWNVTWNWAEDGSSVETVASCLLCGHAESVFVDASGISVAEYEDRYEYTAGIQIDGVAWSNTMVISKSDDRTDSESDTDTASEETAGQEETASRNAGEIQEGDTPDGLNTDIPESAEETEEEEEVLLRNTAGPAVAKVGETEYESLSAAVEAAENGSVIELIGDTEEAVVIPAGKSLTLDLGTFTLTAPAGAAAVTNNGTLTIQGSGNVIANGNYAVSNHGSTLIIDGGNFSKTDPSASQSLIANGWYNAADNPGGTGSQMIINGGAFDGGSYTAVKNDSYGYLTINGGTINSTNASAGVQESGSQLIINGGELNANIALTTASSVAGEQKQVSLSGGTFSKNIQTVDVAGAATASEIQVTLGSNAAFNGSLSLAQPNRITKIAMDHNISGLTVGGTLTLGGYLSDSQSEPFNLTNVTANNITLTSVDPAQPSTLSGCTAGNTIKAGTVTLANTTAKAFECNTKNAVVTVGKGSAIETMRVTTNTGSAIVIDGGSVNSIANVGKTKIGGYESITVNSGTVGSIETSKGNVTVNGGNVDTITISEKFANTNDITVTVADSDAVGQVVNKRASDTSAAAQTNIVLTDPDGEKVYDESTGTYTFKEKEWLLTLAVSSAVYTGRDLTPAVTVQYGETGEALTPESDYELFWKDDAGNDAPELINAGTYTVTASGLGTYAGQTKTAEFTVQQASGRKLVDSITGEEKIFTGFPLESEFTFLDEDGNEIQLEKDKDYKTASYSNNTNAGEASALISYLGNYKGTDRAAFTISKADISDVKITVSPSTHLVGNAEPKVTVKLGSYVVPESEYTLAFQGLDSVGTGTVTVTSKGVNFTEGSAVKNITVKEAVAEVDGVGYPTVSAAISAAKGAEGKTVKLLKDQTLTGVLNRFTIGVSDDITLDMGGHTLTMNGAYFTLNGGKLTVKNGTITAKGNMSQEITVNSGELTIEETAVINGTSKVSPVAVFGPAIVNTAGTLTAENSFAIAGNGTAGKGGYTINVTGGTVSSAGAPAIYHPNEGTVNVSNGTVTGPTAVYQKSGTLNITGGVLQGTGADTDYTYNGNGANATGDALVIDNCGYPGGEPAVSVTGGTFISDNANAVGSYAYGEGKEPKKEFISGGVYSDNNTDTNVAVPEGKTLVQITEGENAGRYELRDLVTVTFDSDGGSKVPEQKIGMGTAAAEPEEDPVRNHDVFAGWYLDGEAYDFTTPVTKNITLKAQWTGAELKLSSANKNAVVKGKEVAAFGVKLNGKALSQEQLADVTWSCDNEEVAAVDPSTGVITPGKQAGTANITASYDGLTATGTVTVKEAVAEVDGVGYLTVSAAISAAKGAEGKTVKLLQDQNLSGILNRFKIDTADDITLDLGGHTLTMNGAYFTLNGGKLTVKNGTITAKGNMSQEITVNSGELTIEETAVINGTGKVSPIAVFGPAIVNTVGTLTAENSFAIAGNGSAGNGGYTINVTGGTVSASGAPAIYHPNEGTVNISGGTVTGPTAVYQKSGTLNIIGGQLHATGTDTDYTYNGNGANPTGDALVIDTCGYPGGDPAVTITGGEFISDNANAVGSYAYGEGKEPKSGFISGGVYSDNKEVTDVAVPENKALVLIPEGEEHAGMYRLADFFTVTFDPDNNEELTTQKVISGEKAVKPAEDPVKGHDTFKGWYLGETEYNFDTPVTADITLKAQWTGAVLRIDTGGFFASTKKNAAANGEKLDAFLVKLNGKVLSEEELAHVTWSSSDTEIASIDETTGKIKPGAKPGDATITAKYDGLEATGTVTVKEAFAEVDGVGYTTAAAALKAVNGTTGKTVTVLKDHTLSGVVDRAALGAGSDITLDLNGKTLTMKAAGITLNGAKLTVTNGTINNISDGSQAFIANSGELTIDSTVTVSAKGTGNAVGVFGPATVNTAGTLTSENSFAITGNGTAGKGGYTVNVTGGSITASGAPAIYHPNAGTLNISDGTITGTTAVYQKSGELNITGGTLQGTGDKKEYTYNGNGANSTGDALVIDNCGYPGGDPAVSITGGEFISDNAYAVGSYAYGEGKEPKSGFISGGVYSDNEEVTDVAVPENKALVLIPEGEEHAGMYRLADLFTVTFDPDNNEELTTQKVISGEKAVKPAENPVKGHDTFKGWYLGETEYNFDTPVTADITLKAQWTGAVLRIDTGGFFASTKKNAAANGEELDAFLVKLNGKVLSEEELAHVIWSSSDTEIASIDEATGKIKPGAKPGDATITAKYDGLEATATVTVKEALAEVDGVGYTTAAAALKAVNGTTGKTVTVLKDHTLSGVVDRAALGAGSDITLDLNGKTLTMKAAGITLNGAKLTVTNGTINNISDGSQAFIANSGELTIDSTVTVSAKGTGNAVGVFGPATVNTVGTLTSENSFAITGNGTAGKGGYTVNVTGGSITASGAPAIYHPNAGTLNISDGTITGTTAVYQKSGELKITGGTLQGTGDKKEYTYNGNGANSTGDALVIDNCGYPGGDPAVSITGGEFISDNADAVGTYSYGDGKEPKEGFIAGGEFSNVVPEKLCAEGYAPVEDKDSKQLYPVHRHIDHLCHVEAVGASCTEDGNTEYWYCEICDAYFSDAGAKTEITDKERVKVPATDHEYEYAVLIPPTCTQMGVKKGVCKHDQEHTILELIDATGHTLQKVEAKPSTCKEEGSTEHWVCTECGALFADEAGTTATTEEEITVAKLAHTPGEAVKENEVAGTCSKKGSYDEVIYCTVCNEEISRTHKEDPATGEHSWGEWTEVIKATCSSNGFRYRSCANDGAHKDYEVVPVTNAHNLEKVAATAATCTEAGTGAYYRCADCGKMFSDEAGTKQISAVPVVKATGHTWGTPVWTWSSDKSIAVARFTCTKCPETKTEIATVKTTTTAAKPGVAGKTDNVASVTVNGKTYTDTKTTPIPALPTEVKATGVSLNTTARTMSESDTMTLTATVAPSNATNKKVTWKSSNPAVATVDANGKVTTKAPGTAVITATAADGSGKSASCTVTAKKASVAYRTHVQTYGWQGYVRDGAMSGTQGQSKRLEGINIRLENLPYAGNIVYRTHVQTYGWQDWKQNDAMSGTSGQSKRLEGIQIYLTGEVAKHYDIYYRVHAQTYGWLGWAKNGVMAGTSGLSRRLEGINIVLVPKGGAAPGSTERSSICGNGTTLPPNPYKEP